MRTNRSGRPLWPARQPHTTPCSPSTLWPPPRPALLLLLAALFGAVFLLPGWPTAAQMPVVATVTASDGLNLRSGANTDADILATIPAGATVTITGAATADGWYPVSYGGMSGWVDGTYLSLGQGGSTSTANPSLPQGGPPSVTPATTMLVDADELNLRASPDASSQILATIPAGTIVQVTGAAVGTWLPVTVNGTSGWMDSEYLSAASASAAPNLPPASSSSPGGVNELGAMPASAGVTVPVTVILTSTSGQPLFGYSFTLMGQQGTSPQTQVTDQSGHATFTSVAPGIYSLSQSPVTGATFASMTVNGASASQGQLFELQTGGTYEIAIVDSPTQTTTPSTVPPPTSATPSPPTTPTPAAPPTPTGTPTTVVPALPPQQVTSPPASSPTPAGR